MSANGWQVWALLSAIFAAFTAVLAKVGVGPIWTKPALKTRTLLVKWNTLHAARGRLLSLCPLRRLTRAET